MHGDNIFMTLNQWFIISSVFHVLLSFLDKNSDCSFTYQRSLNSDVNQTDKIRYSF